MTNDLALDFGYGGKGEAHQAEGWSVIEGDGSWMVGLQSKLTLPLLSTQTKHRIEMDLSCHIGQQHPTQKLVLKVDGIILVEKVLTRSSRQTCGFILPMETVGSEPEFTLEILHPDGWKPSEMHNGEGDQRELSFFLHSLRLAQIAEEPLIEPRLNAEPIPVPASLLTASRLSVEAVPAPVFPAEDRLPWWKRLLG